jgi:hypothetical protein
MRIPALLVAAQLAALLAAAPVAAQETRRTQAPDVIFVPTPY